MGTLLTVETLSPAIRGFLRSLNTLLKSARMYGMEHVQTVSQTREAWGHLHEALRERRSAGLQLAVSQGRLLVDGGGVKAGPAEESFARMLTAADLASVTFTPRATEGSFLEMVRIFAECGAKPEGAGAKLKAALGDGARSGIRINEVRFVQADSEGGEGSVAMQLLAQTLGADTGEVREILHTPAKLLQVIAAAEGASGGRLGAGGAESGAGGDSLALEEEGGISPKNVSTTNVEWRAVEDVTCLAVRWAKNS
jgi:hypothetical protein